MYLTWIHDIAYSMRFLVGQMCVMRYRNGFGIGLEIRRISSGF